ncbi:MAG: hypothetical protein KatS3mg087_1362 [Patescibacteria group bacterium]|nr:MAG: hypothetical protein KatS3mg087_1362 [Patescibacteria group bacterium]
MSSFGFRFPTPKYSKQDVDTWRGKDFRGLSLGIIFLGDNNDFCKTRRIG